MTTTLAIILLGGTISKITNDNFDNRYFPAMLAQTRLSSSNFQIRINDLFARDSTTFTDEEIVQISEAILHEQSSGPTAIVILMGTDGMIKVTNRLEQLLGGNMRVPTVVTGSIIPYRSTSFTDATANFAFAMGVATSIKTPGIYICMNGLTLTPECAEKDYTTLEFRNKCGLIATASAH